MFIFPLYQSQAVTNISHSSKDKGSERSLYSPLLMEKIGALSLDSCLSPRQIQVFIRIEMGGVCWGALSSGAEEQGLLHTLNSPELLLLFPLSVKTVFKEKWLSSSGFQHVLCKRLKTLINISATFSLPIQPKAYTGFSISYV